MSTVPMTRRGAEALREELRVLKMESRPKVVAAIADAREHGDLKENAEYHAAREQQSFIEGRIKELEGKLSNAQIVDVAAMQNNGRVIFGTTVHLADADTGDESLYRIVGEDEADLSKGWISVNSPIARALVGKNVGDVAQARTPNGVRELEIVKVEYI
ncbi:MAG TPA: transcription elongation factor GreA [Nevskiaceae bacterium]|nr:transcription elongation factor GreA [Nevskiaceae bacterium]